MAEKKNECGLAFRQLVIAGVCGLFVYVGLAWLDSGSGFGNQLARVFSAVGTFAIIRLLQDMG